MKHSGVRSMVQGAVWGSLSAAVFFIACKHEPQASSLAGTYVRIWMNLALVVGLWVSGKAAFDFPYRSASLWAWGVLGALTVTCYYAALGSIGAGPVSVLNASFGAFAILLAPKLVGTKIPRASWFFAAAALLGLFCMLPETFLAHPDPGNALGLASGFFAGMAYLVVARSGTRFGPATVLLFWTIVSLSVTTALLAFIQVTWPEQMTTWALFGLAGIFAALSQLGMARAYQLGPVDQVSVASYLGPGLSVVVDGCCFGRVFEPRELLGILLILGAGALARRREFSLPLRRPISFPGYRRESTRRERTNRKVPL